MNWRIFYECVDMMSWVFVDTKIRNKNASTKNRMKEQLIHKIVCLQKWMLLQLGLFYGFEIKFDIVDISEWF